MNVMHERCAGLDVHKRSVTACRMRFVGREAEQEIRTFETTTPGILALSDWLQEWEVSHVAMESTGEYWRPIYNLLEGTFALLVVNARHVKHVPGRKTDVKDAEWLADLLMHGLLNPSFIPSRSQRALRDLVRYRTKLVQQRAQVINRVQKVLEDANIKLASVTKKVLGVSGRAILEQLLAGETDGVVLAQLARGRLRAKMAELAPALEGAMQDHHRFLLERQLALFDFLSQQIDELSEEIAVWMTHLDEEAVAGAQAQDAADPIPETSPETHTAQVRPEADTPLTYDEAIVLLDGIPGIGRQSAEMILAEIGLDMSRFPSAKHLASWTGIAPGNRESGGKRYSGRTPKGNRWLRAVLVQVAWAAARTKGSYYQAQFQRLVRRRGKKRALVAVGHSILVTIYHMLSRRRPYVELGDDYFDQKQRRITIRHLTRRLEKLGVSVTVNDPEALPA